MGYIYLALAIVLELCGTTLLKYSHGFTVFWPSVGTTLSYVFCFFFFSKSLLSINLSIAYATWSGIGIVAATLLSVFLFRETLSMAGVLGITMIIIGAVILNATTG